MKPQKLRTELTKLLGNGPNLAQRSADAIGVQKDCVYKWWAGSRSIPPWLPVMLDLAKGCNKSNLPENWR